MNRAVFCITAVASQQQPSFQDWANQYGFNGDDSTMEAKYNANVAKIEEWNADPHENATFAVNQFSGLTYEEFASEYLMTDPPSLQGSNLPHLGAIEESEVTVSDVHWPIINMKNQGSCGSCWAFSTMAVIEQVHWLNTGGNHVNLAEQQLVDCDKVSSGCSGGRVEWAINYLDGKSIYTTSSYPYRGSAGGCRGGTPSGVYIGGYNTVNPTDASLASALGRSAVSVYVFADDKFSNYHSGILSGSTDCHMNHAVMVTGYGRDYWRIKNSWGTNWGEAGLISIKRTTAGCGPFGIFFNAGVVPFGVSAAVEV